MNKARVYIAGPYTQGDVAANVRAAIEAGNRLMEVGYLVYIPHLNHFWHFLFPHDWQTWINHDLAWLPLCHIFVRLPGESKGADLEENKAIELGLRFATVEELAQEVLQFEPGK